MLTAGSRITQNPFALSVFGSSKSAFLINATTVLGEISNAGADAHGDSNLADTPLQGKRSAFTLL